MLPASNRGAGMSMGFPDVCLTPAAPAPIPIPYPNIAMNAQAAPFCAKVLVTMMPGLNMGSKIPMTMGDEGGTAHPFFKQMGQYTLGNPIVIMEMMPGISLTMPTTGNMMNDPVGVVAVPSATNVMLTFRTTPDTYDAGACVDLGREITESDTSSQWHGDALVVRIPRFSRDVPARVYAAMRDQPRRVVLDLRGNPGGPLEAALELADDFVPQGTHLATVVDDDGDATEHRARHASHYEQPLALLVDHRTASAAEVFAAALMGAGRCLVVGAPTFGKSSAASLVGVVDGGDAQLQTRAHVLTQVPIDGGLRPDVESDDPLVAALERLSSQCHSLEGVAPQSGAAR